MFNKRPDIKKATYFDYRGNHPNIIKPYSPDSWVNYCKEDGDYLEFGKYYTKEEIRRDKNQRRTDEILKNGILKNVDDGIISFHQIPLVAKGFDIIKKLKREDDFARR